jgi:hypothetical protein
MGFIPGPDARDCSSFIAPLVQAMLLDKLSRLSLRRMLMYRLSIALGVSVLSLMCYLTLSTVAFPVEQEVYDKPKVEQPGRTIHGKVIKVVKGDAAQHKWDVSVQNAETGEVVPLRLDKSTARKETDKDPAVGDQVVVKYEEDSKHALTFVADTLPSN